MPLEYELVTNPHNLFVIFGEEMKHRNNTEKIPFYIKIEVTMNHVLLFLGFILNFLIIIIITFNNSLHESTSCYISSFILSNLILLLDTLRNVLLWWYNIDMFLDIQYIINLTFMASTLTLAMLYIDRYIYICSKYLKLNPIYKIIPKFKTALKIVLVIWTMSSMVTAMELHLYAQFKWNEEYNHNVDPVLQIFVISTFIFLVMPIFIIIFLGSLMVCELEQLRLIGGVSEKDIDSLRILAGLTIGFFMTMVPYRVALTLTYTFPNICCSKDILKLYFTMSKGAAIVFPAICFLTSRQIQIALKDTILFCRCNFRSKTSKSKNLRKTISMEEKD